MPSLVAPDGLPLHYEAVEPESPHAAILVLHGWSDHSGRWTAVAERLRRAAEQAKFFAGSPHAVEHLSISIGVAIFGQDTKFKRDLIECADSAMYAAKNSGRNRVLLYSDLQRVRHKEVS